VDEKFFFVTAAGLKNILLPKNSDEMAKVNFIAVSIYRLFSNAPELDFIFLKFVFNGAFTILLIQQKLCKEKLR